MSKIPTPQQIPPTTQQVEATLRFALTASHALLGMDPGNIVQLRTTFLHFYSHPTFQLILGIPSQSPAQTTPLNSQLHAELLGIKSTIQTLSKAVHDLQPKGVKAPPQKTPSQTKPPPPRAKGRVT